MASKPLPPRPRVFPPHYSVEQHNAWILESFERWGVPEKPRPCDCGFWAPSEALSMCREIDRPACRAKAQTRLREALKKDQADAARAKRAWPGGKPHEKAEPGHCVWCGEGIFREDGLRLNLRRKWHEPCLEQFLIRTRPDAMRRFVWRRDEGRCARPGCGRVHGLYGHWDADHVEPLYFAEGRLEYWAPENVVILCREPCHKLKSREDIAAIAAHRAATKAGETDDPA